MQTFAIIVSLAVTAVAVVLTTLAVRRMLAVIKMGQPSLKRSDDPAARTVTMVKETFGHTRMLQWHWVGIMHWFVYLAFLILSSAVFTGYFQLFSPSFALPIIGHFFLFEWVCEFIGLLSTVGIVFLIVYRQLNHPRNKGRQSRFFGSRQWMAYFVEAMALLEGAAILFIRGAEYNLGRLEEAGNPTLAFLASGWEGIKVRLTVKAADAVAADGVLDEWESRLRAELGDMGEGRGHRLLRGRGSARAGHPLDDDQRRRGDSRQRSRHGAADANRAARRGSQRRVDPGAGRGRP